MRNFMIWTLSLLLGFEPALWAQGQAERMAQMKNLIEQSQMAQRPLKMKEVFERLSAELPASQRDDFKNFLAQYGNYKLPKMDASKVKGPNGTEFYRLQAVKDGQSVTVDIVDDGTTFARVNGKNLTYNDMSSLQTALVAVGVPSEEVDEHFPRKPANSSQFLNFEQFQQLKVEDRNKYMKQIRQLMESMEAVEYSFEPQKTSSIEGFNRFDFVSLLIQGENAWAAGSCVAAGHIVSNTSSGRGCGIDSKGTVPSSLRSIGGEVVCAPSDILCNSIIYPSVNGICVPAGRESTQRCNEKAAKNEKEFLDVAAKSSKYNTVEKFQDFKNRIEAAAQNVMNICESNMAEQGDSSFVDHAFEDPKPSKVTPPKKGSKGSKVVKRKPRPDSDQKYQCKVFRDRYDEIKSWCLNPNYKRDYPNLCTDKVTPPVTDGKIPAPVPPVTQPQQPPVNTCPTGQVCCDNLPLDMDRQQGACDASGGAVSTGKCYNTQTRTQENVYVCACPNGLDGKMKCARSKSETEERETSSKKRKKKDKDGPNWLLITGIIGGLMFLGYKAYKSATDQWYKNIEPQPQNPPIPPPPAPPVPQEKPPAPRTGGAV